MLISLQLMISFWFFYQAPHISACSKKLLPFRSDLDAYEQSMAPLHARFG